jgi:ABC-type multidrug transport system ATPase subunit
VTGARLELEGIPKRFGDLVAVNDLSLQLQPGEVFGFVGGNGAGKTTTMRIRKSESGRRVLGSRKTTNGLASDLF